MLEITPQDRRSLRARAHALHPVVAIGQHGLTAAVLHEIDVALAAHGLIKVRVFSDDRDEREAMLARIADALAAAPVQHLGKLLIVWRPLPESPAKRSPKRRFKRPAKRPAKQPVGGRVRARGAREPRAQEPAMHRSRGGASSSTVPADARRRSRSAEAGDGRGFDETAARSPRHTGAAAKGPAKRPQARARGGSMPASPRSASSGAGAAPRRRRRAG